MEKKISIWLIVTMLIQLVAFTTFLVRLDSRIAVMEQRREEGDRFTHQDGELLNQKIDFYVWTLDEMKWDIKEIKQDIRKIAN